MTTSPLDFFFDRCRIPVLPFDVLVKAGEAIRLGSLFTGQDMPQYLVTIHLPDNYDPSLEGEE